jgi:hypothetical protein
MFFFKGGTMAIIKRCEDFFLQKLDDHIYYFDDWGHVYKVYDERKRRPIHKRADFACSNGYRKLQLQENYVTHSCLVHRLIYAWYFEIPDGYEINHKDGNRANNRISNLEAVTPKQNIWHAKYVLGTRKYDGAQNPNHKLKLCDIERIFDLRRKGYTCRQIGSEFGMNKNHIGKILAGKCWKEYSEKTAYGNRK